MFFNQKNILIAIFTAIVFMFPSSVSAYTTYPDDLMFADELNASTAVTNPENAVDDGNFAVVQGGSTWSISVNPSIHSLGVHEITKVYYKIYGNTGGNSSYSSKKNLINLKTGQKCTSTSTTTNWSTTDSGTSQVVNTGNFILSGCTNSFDDLEATDIAMYIEKNSSGNGEIDYVLLGYDYDLLAPLFSFTALDASPSAGVRNFRIEGDTATVSATMKCNVYIGEVCSGASPPILNQKLLTIKLNAAYPLTETRQISSILYEGAGFSATSSAWFAEVSTPYRSAFCTYPQSIECYHTDSEGVIVKDIFQSYFEDFTGGNWTDPDVNDQLYSNITAGDWDTVADCGEFDLLCKAFARLTDWWWGIISPAMYFGQDDIDLKVQLLLDRAPYAYFTPILNMDLSDPSTQSALPLSSFKFIHYGDADIDISYTEAPAVSTVIKAFKDTFTVIIYASFVIYLVFKIRGIYL